MACILCKTPDRFRPLYRKDGYAIDTCVVCGLTQLNPAPSPEVLDALYGAQYFLAGGGRAGYGDYAGQRGEYDATFREEARRLARYVPSGKVLDVGCGFGYFVRAALDAGYDAYGVDVSAEAVAAADRLAPDRVFRGTAADAPRVKDMAFDAIFVSHLIEHVVKPVPFVSDLRERLRPGGHLVVITPNIGSRLARLSGPRWVSFKLPEHVAYYDPDTIALLLESCGFTPLAVQSACQYYRVPFLMSKIRPLLHPAGRVIPPFERLPWVRDRILRVTSGSLRAVARRR